MLPGECKLPSAVQSPSRTALFSTRSCLFREPSSTVQPALPCLATTLRWHLTPLMACRKLGMSISGCCKAKQGPKPRWLATPGVVDAVQNTAGKAGNSNKACRLVCTGEAQRSHEHLKDGQQARHCWAEKLAPMRFWTQMTLRVQQVVVSTVCLNQCSAFAMLFAHSAHWTNREDRSSKRQEVVPYHRVRLSLPRRGNMDANEATWPGLPAQALRKCGSYVL
jgi:hypothetical protein